MKCPQEMKWLVVLNTLPLLVAGVSSFASGHDPGPQHEDGGQPEDPPERNHARVWTRPSGLLSWISRLGLGPLILGP